MRGIDIFQFDRETKDILTGMLRSCVTSVPRLHMTPRESGIEIRMATTRDQCLDQDPVLDDIFEVSDMHVDFLQ
jgi:hypothetical protein